MKPFFYNLQCNILTSFSGRNLLLHLLAISLTAGIVLSGFDWEYFMAIHGSKISLFLSPAIIIGALLPIFLPLVLLLRAKRHNNTELLNTTYALSQAALLGLVISSTYKVFTGRIPPMRHLVAAVQDVSHDFQFGFMRGGVFWGWPSSHTTVAFATMATLFILYPEKKILRIFAICYAFYVGFGVSIGIHWFSEFIAGALIGTAIGVTVGRSFGERKKQLQGSLSAHQGV